MSSDDNRLTRERRFMQEFLHTSTRPVPNYEQQKARIEQAKRARRAAKQQRRRTG